MGARLKFAGYDGVVIQGRAGKPVYLYIQDTTVELRDATMLWGKDTVEVRQLLKGELGNSVRVVAIGQAGENCVAFATVFADDDSSGYGFGAVMGSKNLKAIAVEGRGSRLNVANPEQLRKLTKYVRGFRPNRLEASHRVANTKPQLCYGCVSGCARGVYEAANGEKGKFFCQSHATYIGPARSYYGESNDVPFHANRLCDRYGLDTSVIQAMVTWLSMCYQDGLLTDGSTSMPLSKWGSLEFIETMLRKIAYREGFGDILARGLSQAAEHIGNKAEALITCYADRNGQLGAYGPRLYIIPGLIYAMEPRRSLPQLHHVTRLVGKWLDWINGKEGAYMSGGLIRDIGRKFYGSKLAFDFSTYDGKALATKRIQDYSHANECLILCDFVYPITDVEHTDDHLGDPTVESKLYAAVTGNTVDMKELYKIGERVFNLQRAILAREGHRGKKDDRIIEANHTIPLDTELFNDRCQVPGKDGEIISRKGMVLDRVGFEKMRNEYYQLRGWDVNSGRQTKAKLEDLGLGDITRDLEQRGLVA
jgi:aldehyde:ferredoxin oxidoreductase